MYWYHWSFFGMHFFWWMFWFVVLMVLFSWWTPVSRSTRLLYREHPLDILQRRFAAGAITEEEYEARKARLTRVSSRELGTPAGRISH
ncbi:MAG: SHOCT domain-containing protein [Myxococcales bacterium]